MKNYTIESIKPLIILSAVMGSHAYGTSLPTSDIDKRGIFIQPIKDIIKYGYVEQVSDEKNDIIFYELKRFLDLVKSNNPNILELLNVPKECIIQNSSEYRKISSQKKKFITKKCKNSFGGYAIQQIRKAIGLNKKMNWDKKETIRKSVLDFCYILLNGESIPFKTWLQKIGDFKQEDFALAKINHAKDIYGMYYMGSSYNEKKGIIKNEETSNDVQVVSIPKNQFFITNFVYNQDGYSSHCKMYKEYQNWLNNRNEDRFKMNKSHGKNYDSKNMSHCIRLLDMGIEIAKGKGIIVKRPKDHIEFLMKIRRGEIEYNELLNTAKRKIKEMDDAFENSDLPENIDSNLIPNLLEEIRNEKNEKN